METFNYIILTLFIAVSLGLDAFSVAVGIGSHNGGMNHKQIFRLSFHFGFFQFIMPIIGWAVGNQVHELVADYDHWVAFLILLLLGIKMIVDGNKPKEIRKEIDYTRGWKLVSLSIATSIDALAVGFGISFLQSPVFVMSVIIGITAATMTIFGVLIGERLSQRFERSAERLAGIVLVAIGLHILLNHLQVI